MNPMLRDELASILSEAALPARVPPDLEHPPVDVSPRARTTRAILRIADQYGWRSAITHFLDSRGVTYLSDLSMPQLEDLLDRMHGYVDAAETGCSLEDCLPAN